MEHHPAGFAALRRSPQGHAYAVPRFPIGRPIVWDGVERPGYFQRPGGKPVARYLRRLVGSPPCPLGDGQGRRCPDNRPGFRQEGADLFLRHGGQVSAGDRLRATLGPFQGGSAVVPAIRHELLPGA